MPYVEGFVAAVLPDQRDAFVAHARTAGALFTETGAMRQVEGWGDDVPVGTLTDFHRAVERDGEEVVVFSWLEYPDRATRDASMARIMEDPRLQDLPMPFDGARMIHGGFVCIVDERGEGVTGYVDGCLVAVPTANREAYRSFAADAAVVFRDHGAVRVVENWADDVPAGTRTDFARAVRLQPDESVVFSWIEWPSKDARDTGWGGVMADDRLQGHTMPFDGKRMVYGGFVPIVDIGPGAAT